MEIFSWDYEDKSEADRWFLMARAYLDCSIRLFSEVKAGTLAPSFYHVQAAHSLFEHSVELFLKAGVAQARKPVPTGHNIGRLYSQFSNLYPGKAYEFEGKILDLARPDPNRPHNEFNRYPADHTGQPWRRNSHYSLDIWLEQLQFFDKDFQRLEPRLKARYPYR